MICELCGKQFKRVTRSHLEYCHGVKAEDYFSAQDMERFERVYSIYAEGKSTREVAAATGLSLATVKRVLKRKVASRALSEAHSLGWEKHRALREATTLAALHSEATRQKISKANRGNPRFTEACRERQKRLWHAPEYRKNMLKKIGRKTPNLAEQYLLYLIKRNGFRYRFVGDRSFLIDELNPDFLHTGGDKKVIELFGEYWHDPARTGLPELKTEMGRRTYYRERGYRLLVIWYGELSDNPQGVVDKVGRFDRR